MDVHVCALVIPPSHGKDPVENFAWKGKGSAERRLIHPCVRAVFLKGDEGGPAAGFCFFFGWWVYGHVYPICLWRCVWGGGEAIVQGCHDGFKYHSGPGSLSS
jgi:hypothetical protein